MAVIRVLHVVTKMDMGGIENYLMSNYRNIDRDKIQFDFLTHRSDKGLFDDEIEALGGKIYHVPPINPLHHHRYLKALTQFFNEHKEYKIVHAHLNTFSMYVLRAAKKAGVPVRISHSHAATDVIDLKTIFRIYTKSKLKNFATDRFACSKLAGNWLFGDNADFKIIPNAFNVDDYTFNQTIRDEKRKELGVENDFVIGCTSNLSGIKNHAFLIDVFNDLLKQKSNAKLLLVGDGAQRQAIMQKAEEYSIKDKIIMLGVRQDANLYYQAMDVFALCSVHEGLSIASVEAQASGLACVLSTGIPPEAKVTSNVTYLDINSDVARKQWVDAILEFTDYKRENTSQLVKEAGFDIKKTSNELQNFYIKQYDEVKEGKH